MRTIEVPLEFYLLIIAILTIPSPWAIVLLNSFWNSVLFPLSLKHLLSLPLLVILLDSDPPVINMLVGTTCLKKGVIVRTFIFIFYYCMISRLEPTTLSTDSVETNPCLLIINDSCLYMLYTTTSYFTNPSL